MISLQTLNGLTESAFVDTLSGIYEHSPWVPQHVASRRPFATLLELHEAMCEAVSTAGTERQLALIRAHPELAGKAAIRGHLTAASTSEQKGAGLSACTPEQFDQLQALNAKYTGRFGFPFILAVKGHTPDTVVAALRRRVGNGADEEREVALAQICRIARFRLADLVEEPAGEQILWMAAELARFSDSPDHLTCAYLTPAHQATAALIRDYMLAAGLEVHRDAVGNVCGLLRGAAGSKARLLTGSHYDTVINAGRYDGRLGILLPIVVAVALRRSGKRLPYDLEIVAFAEEEGVRFKSTFLGSRALAGRFDPAVLDSLDAEGVSMRTAMQTAGLDPSLLDAARRDPQELLGFVEVHIEQGPVLLNAGLAVGVVSSIAGSLRSSVSITGQAGHSGTVPMALRHDAAAGAAEIVLAVESRCRLVPGLVGTVGQLAVPDGAVNVIPGRCELSIDVRAAEDGVRDAAVADISSRIREIGERRGLGIQQRRTLEVGACACHPSLQATLSASIGRVTNLSPMTLPSGAGHDAMMMANLTPIGMLFVRCGNGGVSHHPDESLTTDDANLAAQVFEDFLTHLQVDA